MAALLVAALAWGAVSLLGRDKSQAREAADRVAAGLTRGKFAAGSLSDVAGEKALSQLSSRLPQGTKRTAKVTSLTDIEDGKATATIAQTWTFPGVSQQWKYESKVDVTKTDKGWVGAWAPSVIAAGLKEGDTLRVRRVQADRAPILGAGKKPIVELRPVQDIGINKANVDVAQAAKTASVLAKAVGVDEQRLVQSVQSSGPKAFVSAIVARTGSPQEKAAQALGKTPGVYLIPKKLPLAPTSNFARPLLGTVGAATAEIIENSEGLVEVGDSVGLFGAQAAYEKQLSGTPGYAVSALSGSGSPRELFKVDPTPGKPLATTLDIAIQTAAEATLADVGPASAVVAIRPTTGEVVAAASGPGGKGVSTATQGKFAPGSTFKSVSALALLRNKLTPASEMECTPTVTIDGRTFKNVDSYPEAALGKVPFSTAFANSCNTAFIRAGEKVQPETLAQAAAGLGLTAKPQLGTPAFLGSVPAPQPGTDRAASMIGQSKVEASPLGMATVAASIAAGKPVTPTLIVGAAGKTPAPPAAPVTGPEAETLRNLMRGAVTDGSAKFLADTPGGPVLAKTGTAEFGPTNALKQHAWMIAIRGDLAVAVFVAEGEGGAATAGPLLKKFLTAVK